MKKTIQKIALVVFAAAFVVIGVVFGPELYDRLYEDNGIWISEKFTQTGVKTYTKGFEIFGKKVETRKIEIPYTFYMDFTVDLTNAKVTVEDKVIRIAVPAPKVNAYTVTFNDEDIKQSGLASLLSNTEITRLMNEVRDQLYSENVDREDFRTQAWEGTEEALKNLFASLLEGEPFYGQYTLEVVLDESLAPAVETTSQPAE